MATLQGDKPTFLTGWGKFLNKTYRYRLLLKRRWWVLLLAMSIGLGATAWWVSLQPALYYSTGRMMVSGKVFLPEGAGAAYSEELVNFYGTQVELMQSGEVRRRAQERVLSLRPDLKAEPVKVEVGQVKGAAIFTLKATGNDAAYTQAFLQAMMEEYMTTKKEMRSEKSDTTVTAITEELVRLEKELRQGDEELLAFQKANNIGFLQEEGNSAATYLSALNRNIASLRTEYDLLKLLDLDQNLDRAQKNASQKPGDPQTSDASVLSSFGPEAEYLRAKQQIQLLKSQHDDFAKVLRPAHPIMIQLQQEIDRLETLVNTFRTQSIDQLKTRRESIALQLENLQKVVKEWEAKALQVSERMGEFNKVKSKVDRAKSVYERLLTGLRNIDVTKRIDQDTISILDRASPPISVRPGSLKTVLMGLGMGAAAGLAILLLLDLIDDRMTCYSDFESSFSDRVLGQIAQEKHQGKLAYLAADDKRHAFAESFRALRSSIVYLPTEGAPAKTIVVTSAVPNEGKSTIATNLAVALAFGKARVLLIDADVRRGNLHGAFGLKNERGLSEVLRGEAAVSECVQPTPVENLSLLPRGSTLEHSGERFLSKATDELLRTVYPDYDYIVFDSAPVMVADDTASLAPKIDACIFVIRFSFTSARFARKALEMLKNRQVNVMGVVCNDVHPSMPEYYYYYQYSDYYGAAGKDDGKRKPKSGVRPRPKADVKA